MTVTSGFFNSINSDRLYSAEQLSSIFEGMLSDGVFRNIGDAFSVSPDSSGVRRIMVGSGKAWINKAWIYNDGPVSITLNQSPSSSSQKRIDAVVLDVDYSQNVRAGRILVVPGTASQNPSRPTLSNSLQHMQTPLCYVTVKGGNSVTVSNDDIVNVIGTDQCPYATVPVDMIALDSMLSRWQKRFEDFMLQSDLAFSSWFASIQASLGNDAASSLANRIAVLESRVTPIDKGGTASTTKERAKVQLGIRSGISSPNAAAMDSGDIYIQIEDQ